MGNSMRLAGRGPQDSTSFLIGSGSSGVALSVSPAQRATLELKQQEHPIELPLSIGRNRLGRLAGSISSGVGILAAGFFFCCFASGITRQYRLGPLLRERGG